MKGPAGMQDEPRPQEPSVRPAKCRLSSPQENPRMSHVCLPLRYGTNPHQAACLRGDGPLPIRVLNGAPSAINVLDAANAWQLVKELHQALGLPAAASFKHVSPSGAGLGLPLDEALRQSYFLEEVELSPLASAYARARGTDPLSSYGDCAALSEPLDMATAHLLRREVSNVLIAPGFEPGALEVVRQKQDGRYLVLEVDPEYLPPAVEARDVFGMTLEQDRNTFVPSDDDLTTIVTTNRELPEEAKRNALVGLLVLKYTQSNSIAVTYGGQTIGVGAGQQSRLHCARIACDKADRWFLRQHPRLRALSFRPGIKRTDRNNAVEVLLTEEPDSPSWRRLDTVLESVPRPLSEAERAAWLGRLAGATLSSDALIPFRDTLDRAARSGVRYVVQAGGALRDEQTVAAANEYGMVMVYTGTRLFHH